jgi:hypothetical protein
LNFEDKTVAAQYCTYDPTAGIKPSYAVWKLPQQLPSSAWQLQLLALLQPPASSCFAAAAAAASCPCPCQLLLLPGHSSSAAPDVRVQQQTPLLLALLLVPHHRRHHQRL